MNIYIYHWKDNGNNSLAISDTNLSEVPYVRSMEALCEVFVYPRNMAKHIPSDIIASVALRTGDVLDLSIYTV